MSSHHPTSPVTAPDTRAVPVTPRSTPAPPSSNASRSVGASPLRQRFIGIDLARLLAIVGMIASHLIAVTAMLPHLSPAEHTAVTVTEFAATGIAAPLFAVLGGVSMVFAARKNLALGRPGAAVAGVLIRGALLILIGLLLALTNSAPVIVLAYYGVAMILASVTILFPSWLVATLAAVIAAAGSLLNPIVRQSLQLVGEGGSVSFEALVTDPMATLRALSLTGQYPAITWVVYLMVGVLVARLLVWATSQQRLRRVSLTLAAGGAVVATAVSLISTWVIDHAELFDPVMFAAENRELMTMLLHEPGFGSSVIDQPWGALVATPHSGSLFDILRTVGIALTVIGVLTAVFDGGRTPRTPGRVLDVFRAAGAAPLTVYTLHIIATAILLNPTIEAFASGATDGTLPWYAAGLSGFALQVAVVLLLGLFLSLTKRRGPLEALLSGAVTLATRAPELKAGAAQYPGSGNTV